MRLNNPAKVHAINVTFNPERDELLRGFALLAPQVDKIWLVDQPQANP